MTVSRGASGDYSCAFTTGPSPFASSGSTHLLELLVRGRSHDGALSAESHPVWLPAKEQPRKILFSL